MCHLIFFFHIFMRPWKKLFFFVLTNNLSFRRGLTDNFSLRRPLTDNLPLRRGLTDNLSVRRGLTHNLWVRSPLTDNLSVRRPLTDNLSFRRPLTNNLSIRRGLTDNLSVKSPLTDNLSSRRGLTDNLSGRRPLTDNLSLRRPYRKEHIIVGLLMSKKLKREWQGERKISNEQKRGGIHVVENVLQSTRLVNIYMVFHCLLFAEMDKLKKILTQSMPHCWVWISEKEG